MGFNLYYYDKKIECRQCKKKYITYKVRPNRYNKISYDTDFMPVYEGLNPMLYEVNVCPHCGYAYHDTLTRTYGPFMELIREAYIKEVKKPLSICEERTIEDAINSFKLVYLIANYTMEETVVLANFALKITWLCRLKGDQPNEHKYMKATLDLLNKATSSKTEGEERIQYLIAELNLRLGDIQSAKRGFSRLITGKDISNKYKKLATDRWENYKYENPIGE